MMKIKASHKREFHNYFSSNCENYNPWTWAICKVLPCNRVCLLCY